MLIALSTCPVFASALPHSTVNAPFEASVLQQQIAGHGSLTRPHCHGLPVHWIHALLPRQYFDVELRLRLTGFPTANNSSSTWPRPTLLLRCPSAPLLLQTHRGLPRPSLLHHPPQSPSAQSRLSPFNGQVYPVGVRLIPQNGSPAAAIAASRCDWCSRRSTGRNVPHPALLLACIDSV